jgi:hypothetical protein
MMQKKKLNKTTSKTITKEVLASDDVYIQFTDEEIKEFGWEKGQKFECKPQDDGSFKLVPYVKMELDLEEWPIDLLRSIIKESCDDDISINDVINNRLKKVLEEDPIFKGLKKNV